MQILLMSRLFNKDLASLILRLVFGISMLVGHGLGKFQKLLDGNMQFADPFGIGQEISFFLVVLAEFLCAILISIGLLTRFTVIPLIITMITAVFVIHINDPFSKIELGLLYLGAYICILILGAGKYSIDHILKKRR